MRVLFNLFLGALLLSSALSASAAERILNFSSEITVNDDASLMVRETIHVNSEGSKIKRGIYRDFPTRYTLPSGLSYEVNFLLLEVLRDGESENYLTEKLSNGIRIYIGKKDFFLPRGEYTYTILYKTTNQIGFFKDHDELYWNVTGNDWEFPIDQVGATITLPPGIASDTLKLEGYTGPTGSKDKNYKSKINNENQPAFQTTIPLEPTEGLTIVVSWPKGFIKEPSETRKLLALIHSNRSLILGIFGFLILLFYYFRVWNTYGRDPKKGIIIPRFEPPNNFSPAALRYLVKMGFDDKVVACAIINMAAKGYLTIKDENGLYTLIKQPKADELLLSKEEKLIAKQLFENAAEITLGNQEKPAIYPVISELKTNLKIAYHKIYFVKNSGYMVPGLIFSILILLLVGFATAKELAAFMFMSVWLTMWTFGVFALLATVVKTWMSKNKSAAMFITLFSLPFVAGEIFGIGILYTSGSLLMIITLFFLSAVNYSFYELLKAPTVIGRKTLDEIEGFKMYLSVAEKNRLNTLYPPERTPELFEKYLPYALALDVEQQWAEQFSDVFANTGSQDGNYSPAWYQSSSSFSAVTFASGVGAGFASAIASASSSPGSSSGSDGGGSSGGGGGGGGGGGW